MLVTSPVILVDSTAAKVCIVRVLFVCNHVCSVSPELLVRWYQAGVFLSVMRVHSTLGFAPVLLCYFVLIHVLG